MTVYRGGKRFFIGGRFGNFHVYLGRHCVAFGLMTKNDAENWIWSRYPEALTARAS